jgi:hypothetical protein
MSKHFVTTWSDWKYKAKTKSKTTLTHNTILGKRPVLWEQDLIQTPDVAGNFLGSPFEPANSAVDELNRQSF